MPGAVLRDAGLRGRPPDLIDLHASGVLSEGQVAKATGLDRAQIRALADRHDGHPCLQCEHERTEIQRIKSACPGTTDGRHEPIQRGRFGKQIECAVCGEDLTENDAP